MTDSKILPVSPGTIGDHSCLTVDARTLHAALGVKRDFSNWIKARITKYGFEEGKDYEKIVNDSSSPKMANAPPKGLPPINYILTLGMAKELCMVENNEQGRVARRYFIECERRAIEATSNKALQSDMAAMKKEIAAFKKELSAGKKKALPVSGPEYVEKCADAVAQMEELREVFNRTSANMMRVFRSPFWGKNPSLSRDNEKFTSAMNYAIQSFFTATNQNLSVAGLLFKAYVEAEKLLSR